MRVPSCLSFCHGQRNLKLGSFAFLARNLNLSLMVTDNAIADREAQARTLARFLGGEKRIKDPVTDVCRNS